ncbi:MAG: hypothetical protein ABFQ53_02940, partial [Patescibacteria group bacterium]
MKKARKVFVSVLLVMLSFGSVVHASEQENVRLSDNERVKTNMLFRSISQTLNIGYEYNLRNESQRDLYHEQMVSIVEGLKADEWYSLELATWVNPSSVYDIFITNDGEQVVIKID